ncbi:hypothetical protein IPM62_02235 [Candidatus Woesebacteria bacterium]|nr:MAG: hypothetical protein IPM62_02235 [Candidatus Woesebacteria bacterium]
MITKTLIKKVEKIVYEDIEKYGAPSKFQVDYTNEKGQWLANKLGADKKIVLLGTLLMDSKLGQAYKEGRLKDHIEMSRKLADEFLSVSSEITDTEKENILHCVLQHHGVKKFYSLEAEICCNADCYKFASVKGVIGSIKNLRDMPLEDLVKLFIEKAEEKWNALSLGICRKELKPQYEAIVNLLKAYQN